MHVSFSCGPSRRHRHITAEKSAQHHLAQHPQCTRGELRPSERRSQPKFLGHRCRSSRCPASSSSGTSWRRLDPVLLGPFTSTKLLGFWCLENLWLQEVSHPGGRKRQSEEQMWIPSQKAPSPVSPSVNERAGQRCLKRITHLVPKGSDGLHQLDAAKELSESMRTCHHDAETQPAPCRPFPAALLPRLSSEGEQRWPTWAHPDVTVSQDCVRSAGPSPPQHQISRAGTVRGNPAASLHAAALSALGQLCQLTAPQARCCCELRRLSPLCTVIILLLTTQISSILIVLTLQMGALGRHRRQHIEIARQTSPAMPSALGD